MAHPSAGAGVAGNWPAFRNDGLHKRRARMITVVAGSKETHWLGWTGVIAGGAVLLTIGGLVGVPLAGWPGTVAALVFSSAITGILAAAFTHGAHPHP
jgi:hypothetical protein